MLPVTLKQLETFLAVAEARGFRRASERLNLSQSAVTAHVQQLESTLGVPLFHRTTRSVRLTDAGNELLERANRTITGLEDTIRSFRDEAAMTRGRVLVACAPSFASSILPPALAAFQARHPEIFIQVREAYGSEILEALRTDAVDFGIGPLDRDDKDIAFTHLLSDGFVAVINGNDPLAKRASLTLPDIMGQPILAMPRRSATRDLLERSFERNGRVLEPKYEMLHHQTLISMADAGLGIAVLPETAVPPAREGSYAVIPLKEPEMKRRMGILMARGHNPSPAAKAVAGMLPEFVTAWTRAAA
ncbi:MAG: LysR family transcriptional regulator [Rhodospirillales bacterium]|nr:LysR family transcriptional regulator [Rhodospirillales bacterium]